VLLIVMYQAQTWRVRPGETFTFGRAPTCTAVLAEDVGLSRSAASFSFEHGSWWVRNDSRSSLLYLTGDLGFRVDLPAATAHRDQAMREHQEPLHPFRRPWAARAPRTRGTGQAPHVHRRADRR